MKKGDHIVIGFVLILAAFFFIYNNTLKSSDYDQKVVRISIDNELYREITLVDGTHETITVDNAYGYNLIQLNDQKVWIEDADCPDKLCVLNGAITNPGEILVCLPHKLVVEIIGTTINEVDEVSY